MLSFLRRVPGWVLGLIFAVIAVAFIITGMGNPLGGGGGTGAPVAQVGERTITSGQLAQNFDRQLQQVRQETPTLTTEEALDGGALSAVLDRLVYAAGLQEFASRLGLATSKRLVDAEIASMDAFTGPTGQFSEQTYREILARQRINEQQFREDIAGDVLNRQLLAVVVDGMDVPRGVAEPFALRQLEQRTLRVGALPYASFEIEEPTDEELQAFYEENITRFTVPERRAFRYAVFDRAAFLENVVVTDEEVADFYERSDDLYGRTEARKVLQIVTQSEASAEEMAARVRNGEDFNTVAAELFDYAPADTDLGDVSEADLAGTINAEVAAAAFAGEDGTVVGPLETSFGYHVLMIDDVSVTEAQPLAAVAPAIRERLSAEKAETELADQITAVQDAVDDGLSLSEVEADLGLTLIAPPPLTQAGRTPSDPEFRFPQDDLAVLTAAFELLEGDDPAIEQIGEGRFAIVGLEQVMAPAPQPLADIREQVTAAYIARGQILAAEAKAEEIVEAVRAGGDLDALLAAEGVPPTQDLTARRIELAAQAGQLPNYVALGFVQNEGEVASVPFPEQGLQTIVLTADIVEGRIEDAPQLVDTIRAQLREAQQAEIAVAFATAARDQVGVEIFPENIAALDAQYRVTANPAD
ncbi:MAG: SurA N-terminal domain-containing protein [Pacificimonas sp.]|jgi:parvulin-like peptidyl-prolyl isomerase|nr:SurA N-terminal domain-containing protein [Pacificimonas sp.]